MLTESTGEVGIEVPRDRAGTFEPQIVKKRQRAAMALTVIHMIEFRGAPGRHRRWWVLLGALVLAAVFTPWLYLVLAVGIGLGIGAMRRRPDAPKRFTWPAYAVVVILPVRAVILSLYTVWVPHEKVNFLPGTLPYNKTFSYVLSEDNGWIP